MLLPVRTVENITRKSYSMHIVHSLTGDLQQGIPLLLSEYKMVVKFSQSPHHNLKF